MGFTRLSSSAVAAVKGHWATTMHGSMQAAITAAMRQQASAPRRAASAGNGKATLAKNKEALAKALANIPASRAPHASGTRATPANTSANKARLDALLADKD